MLLSKIVDRYRLKLRRGDPGQLLKVLTRDLRSDAVPAVLRDAANGIASLLEGNGSSDDGKGSSGGITINVTIAVAVGAPGKDQDGAAQAVGSPPTESVVIASAVASSPAPSSKPVEADPPRARDDDSKSRAAKRGSPKSA